MKVELSEAQIQLLLQVIGNTKERIARCPPYLEIARVLQDSLVKEAKHGLRTVDNDTDNSDKGKSTKDKG